MENYNIYLIQQLNRINTKDDIEFKQSMCVIYTFMKFNNMDNEIETKMDKLIAISNSNQLEEYCKQLDLVKIKNALLLMRTQMSMLIAGPPTLTSAFTQLFDIDCVMSRIEHYYTFSK
jgi:hypothetical protein